MDNREAIEKIVLAYLLQQPELIFSENLPISGTDFSKSIHRQIYAAAANIYARGQGTEGITAPEIITQLNRIASNWNSFQEKNGPGRLSEILNIPIKEYDYESQYNSLKKYTLFSSLREAGIETLDLYNPTDDPLKIQQSLDKIDKMTYKDIIEHYQGKLAAIEDKYENFIEKSGIEAGEGLEELLQSFKEQPETGLPLEGDIYSTMARGARTKKVYLNSASSGVGKSRSAAGCAAKLGFPYYYDEEKEDWIQTGLGVPVLFITTELEHNEVQTMFLSYISGVNEEKILSNRYDSIEERERVEKAVEIMENTHNVYIEVIPSPSIESVAAKIRLYALQKGVSYVFYDYIHVSTATYTTKKDMRDDVWLMLFVDKLKQLANELDIFISTATQVNANAYEDREVKNESMIRGAKSIADKTDFAMITSAITKQQEKDTARALATQLGTRIPNQIIDVYKNRRGKWRSVRIWRYADLGTCRSWDCFVTDTANNPVDFRIDKSRLNQMVKEGSFPIFDEETGELVAENRKVVEVNDF